MNPKKSLADHIRGWLPKEPVHPTNRMFEVAQPNSSISSRTMGVIAFGSLFSSIFLLFVPYYVSPQSYVPRATPSLGYAAPKTLEAWIFLAAALVLLVLSIFTLSLLALKLKNQGSRWAAHMPGTTPVALDNFGMRIFKIAIAANTVTVAGFLGTLALAKGTLWGTESTVAAVVIFNVLIFSVNLSLFMYYRKQANQRRA